MLTTWHDAVTHILRNVGLDVTDANSLSRAKESVQAAMNIVQASRNWSNAWSVTRIVTSPTYSTGTITYTAATRTVTLSGGTWPTWAAYGTLLIANLPYTVERRVSDTSLLLKSDREPGANVASGTAYVLGREQYALPVDFGSLLEHYRQAQWQLTCVSPESFLRLAQTRELYSQARFFTIMEDTQRADRRAIYFYPMPNTADLIDLRYKRRPGSLRNFDVSTGTVTVSLGGATVTGVGTAWTSALAGAVLRFGTTAAIPDDAYSSTPFQHEARVLSVESATSLTLVSPAEQASSAVKYRISDSLECGTGAMRSALLACALWQFEARRGNPDITSKAYQNYRTLLQSAAFEDQPVINTDPLPGLSRLDAIVPSALGNREVN